MISASDRFRKLVKEGTMVVNYATIILRDGTTLELEPADFVIGGFSMIDSTTNGKFEIGNAIGKTITMTIANHTNKFSSYDFYKSIIYVYVAVKDGETILKERKGKYYVINPSSIGDTITISGVDSMYLFDRDVEGDIPVNTTLQNILNKCCLDCGVQIGFTEFDLCTFQIPVPVEDKITYRQLISYVCQIAGYNARINNDDKLELVWYEMNDSIKHINGGNYFLYNQEDIIDGGNFTDYSSENVVDGGLFTDKYPESVNKVKSLSVSTDDVTITGVSVTTENGETIVGFPLYAIKIKENPFIIGREALVSQHLGRKLIGLKFRPLKVEIPNNPLYEPFDSIYVSDRIGNEYYSLINSVSYKIHGFTTLECKAEDTVRNDSSYVNEYAKAVVEARRNTEKQLSTYDMTVQAMNMLASNAMGLFNEKETTSDGSNIFYMSNRPITKNEDGSCSFEEGSTVYKMTSDGFFVSRNGGVSYESGFDQYGNAVLNVLSVIGIQFDWAKGGTLSLGGVNNSNGSITVLDKNNNLIGKFDNDGIVVHKGEIYGTDIHSYNGNVETRIANGSICGYKNDDFIGGTYYTDSHNIGNEVLQSMTIRANRHISIVTPSMGIGIGNKISDDLYEVYECANTTIRVVTKIDMNRDGTINSYSYKDYKFVNGLLVTS